MAKTLLVLVLIAGAAFIIYQNVGRPASEEEQLVDHFRDRYAIVVNKFLSAAGRSGAIGLDTTFDAETAVVQIKGLRAELAGLRETLTEARAIRKADALADKIETFCEKNGIIRP